MKNVLLLEHYYRTDELRTRLTEWVDYDNRASGPHQRYHGRVAGAITGQHRASGCVLGRPGAPLGRSTKNEAVKFVPTPEKRPTAVVILFSKPKVAKTSPSLFTAPAARPHLSTFI